MKRVIAFVLSISLIFLLVACGGAATPTPTPEPEFDLSEYREMVARLNEEIKELSILLSNMGQWQHSFWQALENIGGTVNFDNMVERVFEWLEENADVSREEIEAAHGRIVEQYSAIVRIDVEGALAEDIRSNITALFEDFNAFYRLITAPSGSMGAFASRFNELSNGIVNQNSMLEILLAE